MLLSDGVYFDGRSRHGSEICAHAAGDRSRLNQFLKLQIEAGNIEEDLPTEDGQPKRARKVAQEAASSVSYGSSRWEMIFVPGQPREYHLGGLFPATAFYSVLRHERRRASYDRTLAQSHMQTEEEENIDHYFRLATNCRRGGNVTSAIFWFRMCVILAPEAAKYHASLATPVSRR